MKKKEAIEITLLTLAVFLLGLLLSGRFWFRVDLTRNKAYSISSLSKNLYREIYDPVTVTYFVSSRLSSSHPMPGEIASLLGEYAAHSRGRIRFIQRDPSGISRSLENLGFIPWQIQLVEGDESIHSTVYSGILIEYLDREEIIPLVFSLESLEYDLSSRIRSMLRNTGREIGIILGEPFMDWQEDFTLLNYSLVLSGFKPILIEPGSWIPSTLSALFVLGGVEGLDISCLLPIDEYIRMGGNVLFALNGVHVDFQGSFEARAVNDMGLLAMLANYGVIVERSIVQDQAALSLTFQTRNEDGTQVQTLRYPPWIAVQDQGMNPLHPITSRALGPDLFWPSSLELFPPPLVNAEVLISTTGEAWLQTQNFVTNPDLLLQLAEESEESRGTKVLAASLSGKFPGFFENDFPGQNRNSRLVIIGDLNFAGVLMRTSQSEERNLELFIRSAEWLMGNEELISLRGRGMSPGRLDRIIDMETRVLLMAFSRLLNTFAIPLGLILTGFIICHRRKIRTGSKKHINDS